MNLPAVVVIAHDKPRHLHRLVRALEPLPVFLHIDAKTPEPVHRQLVDQLPERVTELPRLRAGWARRELLEAELSGYRAALMNTDADHLIVVTGADYPLLPVESLVRVLQMQPATSFAEVEPLPYANWGRLGGWDRFLLLRQWPWRRRRMVLPLPRALPKGIHPAAGSQTKVISRSDAQFVLRCWDSRPDLARFFVHCWIPDETAVPTLLNSRRSLEHRIGDLTTDARRRQNRRGTGSKQLDTHPWHINWGVGRAPNPAELTMADFPAIRSAACRQSGPAWFARKFGEDSEPLLERIDLELRGTSELATSAEPWS